MNRFVFLFCFFCVLTVVQSTSYNTTRTFRFDLINVGDFICTPTRGLFKYLTGVELEDFPVLYDTDIYFGLHYDRTNKTMLDFIHGIEFPSIIIPTESRRELLIRDSCYIRGTPTDPPLHNETLNDLAPYFGPSVHYLY